jgi:ceramide glucosyltransferase
VNPIISSVAVAIALFSLAYVAASVVVLAAWRTRRTRTPVVPEIPVTVLKPLCGDEPGLEENLRSFCNQSYRAVQILFGARDADDPALAIARRVAAEFPDRDIRVMAGAHTLGANRKVNTLAHLLTAARHDVLVLADSDIRVESSYLRHVVAPLSDPGVGVVTCIYRGRPTGGIWSALGALAIDEWFIPSVLVSQALGSSAYCSGTTMALRRPVLDAIGGFAALAPLLADDYELGARVRELGLRCEVPRYEVAATVNEPTLGALIRHELRWMRTIRTVTPAGHALSFLTYALPLTILAALADRHARWVGLLPVLAILLRLALHFVRERRQPAAWLVPVRDLMSFGVWIMSYASRRVTWRGNTMWVRPDGVLRTANEEGIAA